MHPLRLFHYCPRCGSEHFLENDHRSKRCADCGFVYYHNASAATAAFIFNRAGTALLAVRRALDPARGTLDLPGGFVDGGEGLEEGLRREVREEVGAEVTALRYLFSLPNVYPYSGFEVHTSDAFFVCEIRDESAVAGRDDAAAAMWVEIDALQPDDFGLDSIRQAVKRMLELRK